MSDDEIPILTDDDLDLMLPPGRGMFAGQSDTESLPRRTFVAFDVVQKNIRSVLQKTALALGETQLDGTDWRISEVKVGLALDSNGQVSLLAVKGQVGARATIEITLRLS